MTAAPIVVVPETPENYLTAGYGVRSWPTLVLIDPEGNYLGYATGVMSVRRTWWD